MRNDQPQERICNPERDSQTADLEERLREEARRYEEALRELAKR